MQEEGKGSDFLGGRKIFAKFSTIWELTESTFVKHTQRRALEQRYTGAPVLQNDNDGATYCMTATIPLEEPQATSEAPSSGHSFYNSVAIIPKAGRFGKC